MSEFLTTEILENWEDGKKQIIQAFENVENHQALLMEIINRFVLDEITAEQIFEVIPSPLPDRVLLVHIIWTLDFRYKRSEVKEEKDSRERYLQIVKEFRDHNILSNEELKECLNLSTLEDLNLLMQKTFKNHRMGIRRTELFMQRKYNLMSEESEGYSKLLNEFLSPPLFSLDEKEREEEEAKWVQGKLSTIRHIVGSFLLDPNRVLDVLLDVFESYVKDHEKVILEVITKLYHHEKHRKSLLMNWIILKFRWYYVNKRIGSTPSSLYRMAAVLISLNVIEVAKIFPYLMPHNRDYSKQITEHVEKLKNGKRAAPECPYSQKVRLWAHFCRRGSKNKKEAKLAIEFLKAMSVEVRFPCFDEKVWSPLLFLLEDIVEPYYDRISLKTFLEKKQKVESYTNEDHQIFQNEVFPLIIHLSSLLGKDTILFTKVVRVLKSYFRTPIPTETSNDIGKKRLVPFVKARPDQAIPLCSRLVAGLAGMDSCNPSLQHEVWEILRDLEYRRRFDVYGTVAAITKNFDPYLFLYSEKSSLGIKSILQKVVKDDTEREKGRGLCKIFTQNPIACVNRVVSHLGYLVFVDITISMLRYSNQMVRDVLIYRLLSRLSDFGAINGETNLSKVSDVDGYSPSDLLKNYGTFLGKLCAEYRDVRLYPIFDYVSREGSLGSWQDLFIMRKIIENVSNEEIYDDIKPEQVEALCGGHILRMENAFDSSYQAIKKKRRQIETLASWLCVRKSETSHSLLNMISQLRKHSELVRHEIEGSGWEKKMMRRTQYCVDKCQETLMIFIQFLRYHTVFTWSERSEVMDDSPYFITSEGKRVYKFVVPSFETLVEWEIDSEMFFALCHSTLYSEIEYPIEKVTKKEKMRDEDEEEEEENNKSMEIDEGEGKKKKEILTLESLGSHENPVIRYFHRFFSTKDVIKKVLPESVVGNAMNSTPTSFVFYVIFWSLDIHDIHVPEPSYKKTLKKLKEQTKTQPPMDMNLKKMNEEAISGLEKEEKKQSSHVKRVREALGCLRSSQIWDCKSGLVDMDWFLQDFIYPRVTLSTVDAVYCAYFVENILLNLPAVKKAKETSGRYYFEYSTFLKKLCSIVPSWFRFCTEYESLRIARFMTYIFRFLRRKYRDNQYRYHEVDWLKGTAYGIHTQFSIKYVECFVAAEQVVIRKSMLRVLDEMKNEYPEYQVHADLILENLKRFKDEILKDNTEVEAVYHSYVGFIQRRVNDKILDVDPVPPKKKPTIVRGRIRRKKILESASSKSKKLTTTTTSSSSGINNNNNVDKTKKNGGLKITRVGEDFPPSRVRTISKGSTGSKRIIGRILRPTVSSSSTSPKVKAAATTTTTVTRKSSVGIVPPPTKKTKDEQTKKKKVIQRPKVEEEEVIVVEEEEEEELVKKKKPEGEDAGVGKPLKRKREDTVDNKDDEEENQDQQEQQQEEEKLKSDKPPERKRRKLTRPKRSENEDGNKK